MSWSIKLFRIKGIDVRIHLTFLLILVWAAYAWGSGPGAGLADALMGVVVILLLFVCVTLHELGHSLLALHYGSRVRGIVLLPIGGVSEIEEMPGNPRQELLVALIGPLVSLGLGVVFILTQAVVNTLAPNGPIQLSLATGPAGWLALPAYLAAANVLLGIFNLIPAFPMDGGRVLRALMAMRIGERRATMIAAALGQILALLFGLLGFLSGNLFLVLIAIFIWLGAGGESALVEAKGVLGDARVAEAMTRNPLTLTRTDTLGRAVDLLLSTSQTDFPIVESLEDKRLIGLLTREDLLAGLRAGDGRPIGDVMHTKTPVAGLADRLVTTQEELRKAGLHALPVIEDGRVVGLLTIADINEAYLVRSLEQRRVPRAA